jgi:hypothetical protein
MTKRLLRIGLVLLAGCVGLGVVAWVALWGLGFGPAIVVLTNVGTSRVETLTLAEVTEGRRDLLLEYAPLRLGPGESAQVDLERRGDAELEVRLADATGSIRRVALREYLSHWKRLTIEIEISDGKVTRARVRQGTAKDFRDLTWTSD